MDRPSFKSIFWGSTLAYYVNSAILLAVLGGVSLASAAALTKTPREIAPNDVTTLRTQLTAGATSATLDPLKKWVNGEEVEGCFDTGSGFIIIEDDLGRREWASFGNKSCSAAHVTTLSNMRRGLSPVNPSFSSGTGLDFDAGASVRIVDYTLIYEMTTYRDLPNVATGSGSWECGSTSQPCLFLGSYSTAQRNAFTNVRDSAIIYNTETDAFEGHSGGAWNTLGGSGTVNATYTVAGKVEMTTTVNLANGSITDDTGAPLALGAELVIRRSTGAINNRNKLLATDGTGYATGSLLGSGTPSSSTFLRGDQTWAPVDIGPGYFGDGSDGNVSITTPTTLTRDMMYNTLTIASGASINTGGFRIYVKDTLTLHGSTGSILRNGNAGGNGSNAVTTTGGAGGASGALLADGFVSGADAGSMGGAGGSGINNGDGGPGIPGNPGRNRARAIGSNGSLGRAGSPGGQDNDGSGAVGAGGALSASGTVTAYQAAYGSARNLQAGMSGRVSSATGTILFFGNAGSGGGGGGGAGSCNGEGSNSAGGGGGGGGSGGGGGYVIVIAKTIRGTGQIQSKGGAGGTGGNGAAASSTCGGGGGGAGGSGGPGGIVVLVYGSSTSWSGTVVVTGGTPGEGGSAGAGGTGAVAGTAGLTGAIGATGISLIFDL